MTPFSPGQRYSDGGVLRLTVLGLTERGWRCEVRNLHTGGYCTIRSSPNELMDALVTGGWRTI